jgi:hypothetical protein
VHTPNKVHCSHPVLKVSPCTRHTTGTRNACPTSTAMLGTLKSIAAPLPTHGTTSNMVRECKPSTCNVGQVGGQEGVLLGGATRWSGIGKKRRGGHRNHATHGKQEPACTNDGETCGDHENNMNSHERCWNGSWVGHRGQKLVRPAHCERGAASPVLAKKCPMAGHHCA